MKTVNDYRGIYKATVVGSENVTGTGKIQLRVPALHGISPESSCSGGSYSQNGSSTILLSSYSGSCSGASKAIKKSTKTNYTLDEDLPWASRSSPFPCGDGYGSYILPQKGDSVWVMFEDEDPNKPVVIGSAPSTGSKRIIGEATSSDKYSTDYTTSGCNENISENKGSCYSGKCCTATQTVSCVYKSPKGAGIFINENDENESFHIIDRGGQGLFFGSPVKKSCNVANKSKRDSATAITNGGLPLSKFTDAGPSVVLAGGYGQSLSFSKSSVILTCSKSVLDSTGSRLLLSGENGGSFSLKTSGSDICQVSAKAGKLSLYSDNGAIDLSCKTTISLSSSEEINLSSQNIKLTSSEINIDGNTIFNGNVIIYGDVLISGNLTVTGSTNLKDLTVSGRANIPGLEG